MLKNYFFAISCILILAATNTFAIDMNQVVKQIDEDSNKNKKIKEEIPVDEDGFRDDEANPEEVAAATATPMMDGDCFANWGIMATHMNPFYLKTKAMPLRRIGNFFEQMDTHVERTSNLIKRFSEADQKHVKARFAELMKIFGYDKINTNKYNEYLAIKTGYERQKEILVQFFRDLYPEPLVTAYAPADLKRFESFKLIAESREESLEETVLSLSQVILRNNQAKAIATCSEDARSLRAIFYSYVRNAGVMFPCTNCQSNIKGKR